MSSFRYGSGTTQPKTVGDRIRKRCLELKMLQREVAEMIGVDKTTVFQLGGGDGQASRAAHARGRQVSGVQPGDSSQNATVRTVVGIGRSRTP